MLLGISLIFSSCNKEEKESQKIYIITVKGLGRIEFEKTNLTICEYNDLGNLVGVQSWNGIKKGDNKGFIPNVEATKLKIYTSVKSQRLWVLQVFYLKDDILNIVLDENTLISEKEPQK